MGEKRICYHLFLVPTAWDQKRPGPCEVNSCRCGQNWTCPVCGYGQGSWPHVCDMPDGEHERLLKRSLVENADIWRALADA